MIKINGIKINVESFPDGTQRIMDFNENLIHVGYENPDVDTSLALVKYMDVFLGIPSVVKDKDKKRRSLYGKAGCFRLTDYGKLK